MFMRDRIVNVTMSMPLTLWNISTFMQMVMMILIMSMDMYMFKDGMCMKMAVSQYTSHDYCKCQECNRDKMHPLK